MGATGRKAMEKMLPGKQSMPTSRRQWYRAV